MIWIIIVCFYVVELTMALDYCSRRKDHPFCINDCISLPKSCQEAYEEQISITERHIKEILSSLNHIRTQLVRGKLAYKFYDQSRFPHEDFRGFPVNQLVNITGLLVKKNFC